MKSSLHSQWMDNDSIRVRPLYKIWIWTSILNKDHFQDDMKQIFSKYGTGESYEIFDHKRALCEIPNFSIIS